LNPVVLIDRFHALSKLAFTLALAVYPTLLQCLFRRAAGFCWADTTGDLQLQHVTQGAGDQIGGVGLSLLALVFQMIGGGCERLLPASFQLAESSQQPEVLLERRGDGIKPAHNPEILAQCILPAVTVVVAADGIDQREAGPPGPLKNGHFRFIGGAVGHRPVNHIDNAGILLKDGLEQLAFVMELRIIPVLVVECLHGFRPVGCGSTVGFKPGQKLAWALKTGCVDQGVKGVAIDGQRVSMAFAGGARFHRNGNTVILRQRSDDTGFAAIRVADDCETGRFSHDGPPLKVLRARRRPRGWRPAGVQQNAATGRSVCPRPLKAAFPRQQAVVRLRDLRGLAGGCPE